MDANKFTRRSQEAIGAAIELATSAGNPSVEPVHLLSALLPSPTASRNSLLRASGVDPQPLAAETDRLLSRLPAAQGSTVASPSYSRPTILTLQSAEQLAESLGDEYISTEHLMVALATIDSPAKDVLTGVRSHR